MNVTRFLRNSAFVSAMSISLIFSHTYASPANPELNIEYRIASAKTPLSSQTNGKVDVVEFFSYSCPHCYAFDPILKSWISKNKSNINFKRMPANFNATYEKHQKIFYALEAMNQGDILHDKVFDTVQKDNNFLQTDQQITKFAAKYKIDSKKLLSHYYSFGVATKVRQATQIMDDYKIDGVPTVLIGGKYITSSQMVGGRDDVLKVMDYLVKQVKLTK
jgi:protein dithiol oxidoreductase (disulfide-forming)